MMAKLFASEVVRYIFFGILTTGVNFASFFLLFTLFGLEGNLANTIAIAMAIVFAFAVNKIYVFHSKSATLAVLVRELSAFVSARLISMALEVAGFFLLYSLVGMDEYLAKVIIGVFVVALNYFVSKFLIFKKA